MSNYHVMRVTAKKDQADVVFHFAIPDAVFWVIYDGTIIRRK